MVSAHQHLQAVISSIIHEEREFQARAKQMRLDQHMLDFMHNETAARYGHRSQECPHLAAHEAMFKVHRKMVREHSQTLIHCRRLEEKYRRAQTDEQEIMTVVGRLQSLLRQMQEEHRRLETERRNIIREHSEFVKTLSANC